MKKFQISIPTPCHEDWNAMKPEEKGRFCASCQKTVTDFTGMSDRRLAEYFKKPQENLCGRFHADQLNRTIEPPSKRLPWLKLFFRFTWPAFVLFLKSCGQKSTVQGELTGTPATSRTVSTPHMEDGSGVKGLTVSEIYTVGDTILATRPELPSFTTYGFTTCAPGEKKDPSKKDRHASARLPVQRDDSPMNVPDYQDPVAVPPLIRCEAEMPAPIDDRALTGVIAGGISIRTRKADFATPPIKSAKTETMPQTSVPSFSVFPNPVHAGSLLTVSYPEGTELPVLIQILSASGQLVHTARQNETDEATVFNLAIPARLSAGVYVLRLIGKDGKAEAKKIVVE